MKPKDELFAQLVADGKPVADAYQEAGFTGGAANARRKKAHPAIKTRIAELLARKQEIVERGTAELVRCFVYDAQRVIDGLYDVIKRAEETDNLSELRQTWIALGKQIGMFAERNINLNLNADINSISDADLAADIERLKIELAGAYGDHAPASKDSTQLN